MIRLSPNQADAVFAHATDAAPEECCGLLGGQPDGRVVNIYRLRNVAVHRENSYEAAPEDLFAAQREMRAREEQLIGIYHSHPRSTEPTPSQTDVRLAYYPQAVYFIVGLAGARPVMRAFRISERDELWQEVEYAIVDE